MFETIEKLVKSAIKTFKNSFSVSPRILDHLGIHAYNSIKKSLVELASNSYDADSTELHISIPKKIENNSKITLEDNGMGMTTEEFQENYLKIGRNRRMESDVTLKGRKVIGNKGIGKLAGFGIADLIQIETCKNGVMTTAILKREAFDNSKSLENTKFDVQSYKVEQDNITGTKITLKRLRKDLSVPKETFLRRFIRNHLPKYDNFKIFVNNIECTSEDVPHNDGDKHSFEETISTLNKKVKGYYIIARTNQAEPGFSVRVRGRLVTKPSFFELPLDSFTGYLGKKFTGEIHADFLDEESNTLQSLINTSRDGFIEDNEIVEQFNEWVKSFLKKILKEENQKRITGQTNKILQSEKIESRLNSLPNSIRSKAKEIISTLVSKMKEADEQSIIDFASLVLQYFESNILKELVDRILQASSKDIEKLADLVSEWGVRDVSGVAELIKHRIDIIKKLKELVNDDAIEGKIHKLFSKNLWLINDEYRLWSSNRTIKNILDKKLKQQFKGKENLRPDLVCLENSSNVVIIEFKRPTVKITTRDFAQVLEYKGILQSEIPQTSSNIVTFVIGKTYDETVRAVKSEQEKSGNFLMSYFDILIKAEKKFSEILDILQNNQSI